jgi:hypothetical protein
MDKSEAFVAEVKEQLSADAPAFKELEKALAGVNRAVFTFDEEGGGRFFLFRRVLKDVLPKTLFERLLKAHNQSLRANGYEPGNLWKYEDRADTDEDTRALAEAVGLREGIGDKFLAIPLERGTPKIAGARGKTRPFYHENLHGLNNAWLSDLAGIRIDNPAKWYKQNIAKGVWPDLYLRVPLHELLAKTAEIARVLDAYHKSGWVHADVKPANILFTGEGVHVIDELAVKPGEKSPALTRIYAAPEVILRGATSFATDVYALGVILLLLLGGVGYGEVRNFAIPLAAKGLANFQVLRCDGVYIDPGLNTVPSTRIGAWQEIIAGCLEFDPARRPKPSDVAGAIDGLLEVPGYDTNVVMPWGFGELGLTYGDKDPTEAEIVWVIGGSHQEDLP